MIHAENARELTEKALASLYEEALENIEINIEGAANKGYNHCIVSVHENLVESVEFTLHNCGYAVYFIDTDTEKEVLKISW